MYSLELGLFFGGHVSELSPIQLAVGPLSGRGAAQENQVGDVGPLAPVQHVGEEFLPAASSHTGAEL